MIIEIVVNYFSNLFIVFWSLQTLTEQKLHKDIVFLMKKEIHLPSKADKMCVPTKGGM